MLECAAGHNFEALMVLGHPGKLAKLAMGEADTHSSRSKSAVPFVSGLAKEVLDLPSPGGVILGGGGRQGKQPERHLMEVSTVEGVFSALSEPERNELGKVLADKIRMAVTERTGDNTEIAVVLVDMQGNILGSNGDLSRWM